MRDAAAIVGIHQTPFAARLDASDLSLATQAIAAALNDAGLTPSRILKNAPSDGTMRRSGGGEADAGHG